MQFNLPNEQATIVFGAALAPLLMAGMIIFLEGELGAGKTTLVRAILHNKGYSGKVKSPTYTIVEVYTVSRLYLYHFDFYRFTSPEELLDAGLDEYFRSDSICLIEWPQNAAEVLPSPDLWIRFALTKNDSRLLSLEAFSKAGQVCLNELILTHTISPFVHIDDVS